MLNCFLQKPLMSIDKTKLSGLRIGEGHDTHRTAVGRPLIIGGVHVTDADFGLDGHSDADVLLHAVIDALLGATGQGDIGEWFPNTSEEWKNADSTKLLDAVLQSVWKGGWRIINLDCTIHAERPRMVSWKPKIRSQLAELLRLSSDVVNVKAKSGEQVGPVGRGESISADVIVLMTNETD
jgi:2-C-methyl-D-erythritol 2,4-cyclodiphosphate synthase